MTNRNETHIFISHATIAEGFAIQIFSKVEDAGYKCWFAQRDVQKGEHYASELSRALKTSMAVLLILDENANNSKHVLREITIAIEIGIPVFTVQIGSFPLGEGLDYLLSGIQRIISEPSDLELSSNTLIQQLSKTIPHNKEPPPYGFRKAFIEVPPNVWDFTNKLPFQKWLRDTFEDKQ